MTKIRSNRLSTEYNFLSLHQPMNPIFTEADHAKKLNICGVAHFTDCFVCKNNGGKNLKAGDHLYECKGYHEITGEYGVRDKWNTLPVCSNRDCNKNYKKIRLTDGRTLDAGHEDIPIELVPPHQQYIVETIQKWKAYTARRHAVLHFKFDKRQQAVYEKALKKYDDFVVYMQETTQIEKDKIATRMTNCV